MWKNICGEKTREFVKENFSELPLEETELDFMEELSECLLQEDLFDLDGEFKDFEEVTDKSYWEIRYPNLWNRAYCGLRYIVQKYLERLL